MTQLFRLQSHFITQLKLFCEHIATTKTQKIKMKAVIAVLCFVAVANAGVITNVVAPATVIARAPSLDSAVIQSDRIGGNFAYSVSEAHAHVAHTPIIQHVATPVAVTHSIPHLVASPALAHHVVAAPLTLAAPQVVTSLGAPAATVRIA